MSMQIAPRQHHHYNNPTFPTETHMTTLAVINLGLILTGDLTQPTTSGDCVLVEDGTITAVGDTAQLGGAGADTVIDAAGGAVMPGLIDSHFHVVIGEYQPRQKVVDFIDSYVHGGVTSMISAGEIHTPGRPRDKAGVKALAIAAQRSYAAFRPTGAKVHAGAVVLEPTLDEPDFTEMAEAGVWLAKFGFGDYRDPIDGEPQVRWAKDHGMVVMCHSGGTSIPGSKAISAEHLMRLRPNVCGHVNGGPTALEDDGVRRVVSETDMVYAASPSRQPPLFPLHPRTRPRIRRHAKSGRRQRHPHRHRRDSPSRSQDHHRILILGRHTTRNCHLLGYRQQRQCLGPELRHDCPRTRSRPGPLRRPRRLHPQRPPLSHAERRHPRHRHSNHRRRNPPRTQPQHPAPPTHTPSNKARPRPTKHRALPLNQQINLVKFPRLPVHLKSQCVKGNRAENGRFIVLPKRHQCIRDRSIVANHRRTNVKRLS